MGLLSRKKAAPAPQPTPAAPPAISAPISIAATPAVTAVDHAKPSVVAGSGVTAMAHSSESILPSPPRSPVAASYAEHEHTAGSYGQPTGNSNRYQDNNDASYTSRDTQEHQYVSNGLHGGYGGHTNGKHTIVPASSRADYEDADMADATQSQYQPYQAHHTSGAQARPIETSRQMHQQQSSTSSYGYGSHVVPQRQIPRPAETPQVVISPTPSQGSSVKSRRTSSRYSLADFTFIRTLGTGSFGRVHLVRSQHNSRSYAIKVLSKERVIKMKQVEHTNSEREMLERVRHPFLVNLWGTFKDSKNLYMVMDFVAGGELFSLLRKSQRFPDPVAKFFAAEVALALDYLHSLDIIYRDLKPENILLGADGHIKVTDFGFAKHVPDITWTLCGTPDYLAPEIVQSRGYNKSVDWYALGVLMFEMLAGYPPFFTEDSNPMRLYEKIIAGKIRYPAYFTPEAKDLLKSLLTSDMSKRFGNLANGSRDIFGHVWFQEVDWERLYRKEIPAPYVPKVEGDWDASNFDAYPEVDLSEYGSTGPDPHGHLFPLF
ncbi:cAMP-dependent protein kinase type 1 [Rhodotorula sp. CCFEE 5036]|nr:cAMP-dependent protein kinase type 1 [Rhodotorula sp. CCFEE 5036]